MKTTKLTAKQWSILHRLDLSLEYWLRSGYSVFWVTLTSSPSTKDMRVAYRILLNYIEYEYGSRPVYCRITTSEGCGVYHCFWIFEDKRIFIKVRWLREKWESLTGAFNLNIQRVGGRGDDAKRVARYAVSQYAVNQGSSFVRCDWSRQQLMPVLLSDFLRRCRAFLRSEIYTFTPWHVGFKLPVECARALLTKGFFEVKGYRLGVSMDYNILILSSPI